MWPSVVSETRLANDATEHSNSVEAVYLLGISLLPALNMLEHGANGVATTTETAGKLAVATMLLP